MAARRSRSSCRARSSERRGRGRSARASAQNFAQWWVRGHKSPLLDDETYLLLRVSFLYSTELQMCYARGLYHLMRFAPNHGNCDQEELQGIRWRFMALRH